MTRHPYDKPSKSDFKKFWSVYEAKQQRKRDQLNQLPIEQQHHEHEQEQSE
jgi:hypothetical protein